MDNTDASDEYVRSPSGTQLIIFGITGDLSRKKLLPALYHLAKNGSLPENFEIFGITRRGADTKEIILDLALDLQTLGELPDGTILKKLQRQLHIVTMDVTDPVEYDRLRNTLEENEQTFDVMMQRLIYLSIPPQMFGPIVDMLGTSGLNTAGRSDGEHLNRLLIEKPFGYDLTSAMELIERLENVFTEEQIFRVDHYLAKETAQNILTFRFANPLFKLTWDADNISFVTITAAEAIGIEGRSAFYEQTGALRDLIQSHLLQLMTLATMEEPHSMDADAIHAEKLKLLQAVVPVRDGEVDKVTVRGQYIGYQEAVDNPKSHIETYAAIRLSIENDRWRGVPILLRTGKALTEKMTSILIGFRTGDDMNTLTIRIQPDEGITLRLQAKSPGMNNSTEPVEMSFRYSQSFSGTQPDAYERVLIDSIRGDKTLFATSSEVLRSWEIIEAVIHAWSRDARTLESYPQGSWGPPSAITLENEAENAVIMS